MSKDPAVLIYIDKWIASTNDLKASWRAWYFDLLLYQYDHGTIPEDEDTIYGICRVRPSEYQEFKQMLNQVLKQKFKQTEVGLVNDVMNSVLKSRNDFKEKRSQSGNIGVIIKMAKTFDFIDDSIIEKLKNYLYNISSEEIEKLKNKHLLKQMVKQMLNLYIDKDVDIDKTIDNNINAENQKISKNEIYGKEVLLSQSWIETIAMQNKISIEDVPTWISEFNKKLISELDTKFSKQDYASHFSRWLPQEIKKVQKTSDKDQTFTTNR